MSSQKDRACEAARDIGAPRAVALQVLSDVLSESRKSPPDGAADGSLSPEQWAALCRIRRAAGLLREEIALARRSGLEL